MSDSVRSQEIPFLLCRRRSRALSSTACGCVGCAGSSVHSSTNGYCANKRASIQFSASPPRTINWETSTSLSGSSLVVILLLLAARRRSQFPSFVSGKCVCFGSTQLIGVSVRVRFIFIFCGTDASVYFVRYTSILT